MSRRRNKNRRALRQATVRFQYARDGKSTYTEFRDKATAVALLTATKAVGATDSRGESISQRSKFGKAGQVCSLPRKKAFNV